MSELEEIINSGISLADISNSNSRYSAPELIFISLRSALKSFFSLPGAYRNYHELLEYENGEYTINDSHEINSAYTDIYYRGIIHFQHFFELVIKEILRQKEAYLAINSNNDIVIIHKLITGTATAEDLIKINTVEFSEALKRLKKLCNNNIITGSEIAQLLQGEKQLVELNTLRNRIWHRGTFILNFHKYFIFISKYILPLIEPALKSIGKDNNESFWKYKTKSLEIEPLSELTNSTQNNNYQNYNFWKTCLLLEIGRAAYINPLPVHIEKESPWFKHFSQHHELKAKKIVKEEPWLSLETCIICGLNTLIVHLETGVEQDENGVEFQTLEYSVAYCECCSFRIENYNMDPDRNGYSRKFFDI